MLFGGPSAGDLTTTPSCCASHTYPRLEFGEVASSSCTTEAFTKLERQERAATRFVVKLRGLTYEDRLQMTQTRSIPDIRLRSSLDRLMQINVSLIPWSVFGMSEFSFPWYVVSSKDFIADPKCLAPFIEMSSLTKLHELRSILDCL